MKVQLWDGVSPINGVPAEEVLANRKDIARNLDDVFLVLDDNDHVCQIEFGRIIAGNFGIDGSLSVLEIGEQYLIKMKEMEEAEKEERLTIEELQEQVAMLSYDVMMMSMGDEMAMAAEGEEVVHSPRFKMIKIWFNKGFWTKEMVGNAVVKGWLTEAERVEIVGE